MNLRQVEEMQPSKTSVETDTYKLLERFMILKKYGITENSWKVLEKNK